MVGYGGEVGGGGLEWRSRNAVRVGEAIRIYWLLLYRLVYCMYM